MKAISINLSFLAITAGFTAFSNYYFFTYVAKRNCHSVRVEFLKRCLEQDADFFDKNSPNEMAAKLMVNAEELFDGTGTNFAMMCQLYLASFGSFVVVLIISPYLFFAFLVFMLITFTVLGVIMTLWIGGIQKAKAAYGQANGYADQALSAFKVV